MSKLEERAWGWEYTSDNGIVYEVGEVSAEYNVVFDRFNDISELFDTIVLLRDHLVDYVYGNLCGDWIENLEIKTWLDWRISQYENHERTVRFYRDVKDSDDELYECYIGLAEEKHEQAKRISRERLEEIAKEDRNNNTK